MNFLDEMELFGEVALVSPDQEERMEHLEPAVRFLDLSEIPMTLRNQQKYVIAVKLYEILRRSDLPAVRNIPEEIVDNEQGWTVPGTRITMNALDHGAREGDVLFTAKTVNRIHAMYEEIKALPILLNPDTPDLFLALASLPGIHWLSQWIQAGPEFLVMPVFSATVWQWVALLILLLLEWQFMRGCYILTRKPFTTTIKIFRPLVYVSFVFTLLAMAAPLWLRTEVTQPLRLHGVVLSGWVMLQGFIFNIALVGVVLAFGRRLTEWMIARRARRSSQESFEPLIIRLVGRVGSISVAVIIFVESCKSMGIPVSTILAGAGVGGLALALGAQDSVKNLLGGMMLLMDKPAKVGERILAAGFDGVVEDIGLRSTKLRLLSGHQAILPNEQLAQAQIENIARRPFIKKVMEFPLSLQTEPAKISQVLDTIKVLLKNHEGLDEEYPPRVFLDQITTDRILIKVLIWYHPPQYWDFIAWAEKTTLEILSALKENGIELSEPVQKIKWKPPEAE